jgi:hypothetical protein
LQPQRPDIANVSWRYTVIASAAKQSSFTATKLDCFVASLLAMTGKYELHFKSDSLDEVCVPRMLRNAPHLRRGALLIRGPLYTPHRELGSRLCGAS